MGTWSQPGEKKMELTDIQIARLFKLCREIAAVEKELPIAPRGFDVSLETARNLRVSLAQHNAALIELALILGPYTI
jgi:hypothetical protein